MISKRSKKIISCSMSNQHTTTIIHRHLIETARTIDEGSEHGIGDKEVDLVVVLANIGDQHLIIGLNGLLLIIYV